MADDWAKGVDSAVKREQAVLREALRSYKPCGQCAHFKRHPFRADGPMICGALTVFGQISARAENTMCDTGQFQGRPNQSSQEGQ